MAALLDELQRASEEVLMATDLAALDLAPLEHALAEASAYAAEFAYHPAALDVREEASFALIVGLSYAEPPREAEAAARMDEVIRSGQGRELDLTPYGPTLTRLHAERLAELRARGTAELIVNCAVPCRVIINERARSTYPSVLLLGRYRVRVESRDGVVGEDYELELGRAGEIVELDYPPQQQLPDQPPELSAQLPAPRLRRWEEIVLMTASAGVVAGGGAVFGPHNQCIGDPSLDWRLDPACDEIYNTAWIGGTLVAIGAAGLITLTYLLIDDEKRRRNMRAVSLGGGGLGWSLAF